MQESLEAARFESLTDPLTALANRKHFDMALERLMRSASEQHRPLALLLGDIDHFKRFNDKHGHQTGDQVLRLVAAALRQVITEADLAARYGGEDFAIILPDTSLRDALARAEQARLAVWPRIWSSVRPASGWAASPCRSASRSCSRRIRPKA